MVSNDGDVEGGVDFKGSTTVSDSVQAAVTKMRRTTPTTPDRILMTRERFLTHRHFIQRDVDRDQVVHSTHEVPGAAIHA